MKDEWTSVSDIGRMYSGGVFTLSDYLATEEAYVETVRRFLASTGDNSLRVSGLEFKADCGTLPSELAAEAEIRLRMLREGMEVLGQNLDWVVRLNLRELVWCRLEGKGGLYVHFGYDYYMYVGIEANDFVLPSLPPHIYAEPCETPYRSDE